VDTLETIATRLQGAGAVFSVHAPPLTSLSFIQPLPPGALGDIARMTCVEELYLGGSFRDLKLLCYSEPKLMTGAFPTWSRSLAFARSDSMTLK
jgi:hypothetical protein